MDEPAEDGEVNTEHAHTQQCAVVDCGCEDSRFLVVCENRHRMHSECVRQMFAVVERPRCPMCRDDSLSLFKQHALAARTSDSDSDTSDISGSIEELLAQLATIRRTQDYLRPQRAPLATADFGPIGLQSQPHRR